MSTHVYIDARTLTLEQIKAQILEMYEFLYISMAHAPDQWFHKDLPKQGSQEYALLRKKAVSELEEMRREFEQEIKLEHERALQRYNAFNELIEKLNKYEFNRRHVSNKFLNDWEQKASPTTIAYAFTKFKGNEASADQYLQNNNSDLWMDSDYKPWIEKNGQNYPEEWKKYIPDAE